VSFSEVVFKSLASSLQAEKINNSVNKNKYFIRLFI